MVITEVLTEREQQGLEHMRKAQELGVTLKEYAARIGAGRSASVSAEKAAGAQGCARAGAQARTRSRRGQKIERVLPVRVVSAAPQASGTADGVPAGASERLGVRVRWVTTRILSASGADRLAPGSQWTGRYGS